MQPEIKKKIYNQRKEAGLCPECGGERDDKYIKCSHCREIGRKSQRKHYKYYKENNLCPSCGKYNPEKYVYCRDCRIIMRDKKRLDRLS